MGEHGLSDEVLQIFGWNKEVVAFFSDDFVSYFSDNLLEMAYCWEFVGETKCADAVRHASKPPPLAF